ncbi:MAG TPA: hypothetical protein VJB16_04720, partial [archaeon]|nr:hypothetical protein [archaeon]
QGRRARATGEYVAIGSASHNPSPPLKIPGTEILERVYEAVAFIQAASPYLGPGTAERLQGFNGDALARTSATDQYGRRWVGEPGRIPREFQSVDSRAA